MTAPAAANGHDGDLARLSGHQNVNQDADLLK
jgi:hypothetical protein